LLLMGAVEQRTRIDAAMLAEVIADLERDGTLADQEAPAPIAEPAVTPVAAAPSATPAAPDAAAPAAAIAGLAGFTDLQQVLGAHGEQIVELQKAVLELADMPAAPPSAPAADARLDSLGETLGALQQRMVALEARSAEQEQAVRHVLTMLIEWIESEAPRRAA